MSVLNMQEACTLLRVAKPTLYKYIRKGQIPAFKMGRVWRFDEQALKEWVKTRIEQDTQARSEKRN